VDIAIPLFDRMTALDAVGPYEVLWRLPDVEIRFVGSRIGPVQSDRPLKLVVDNLYDQYPTPDIVLVPGGFHGDAMMNDTALVEWVKHAHETSTWTTSVCTGALVLGKAGVLHGKKATTHWAVRPSLVQFGATPVAERVVVDGKVMTGAGVSAGIDMALTLAALIAGKEMAEAIQLSIEYDPKPPFHTGSIESAPPEIVQLQGELAAFDQHEGPAPVTHPIPNVAAFEPGGEAEGPASVGRH
jgi:transcriptional regulator GlxA family with amidase domain